MSSASSPLLDFRDVSRSFTVRQGVLGRVRGEVRAVDGVSLSVRRGETLGLVGESGCGKSTLARMAVRLLPPTSGEILFDGEPVSPGVPGRDDTWYSRRLQMVFQDPFSSLNPRLRIGTSIAEPLMAIGTPQDERKERVGEILRRVGLQPEHAGRYPHEFSGGQRQRVAIARALVTRPELVVCDEAVSALDASVQAQVLNLLKEVQADFGLTYLFISHDLSVVGYMSDRVAVMYLGRIVEQADRDTLFGSAAHPYTKALLAAAPVHDPTDRRIRAFLPGELPSPFSPPAGCAFYPRCPQVMPRCREEAPELREIAPEHLARCHLYG
ncbi:oligopeptide/dipeptide ABC transporter ATP-binding protein [uncultured Bilophila sp.]|uniref:ABC transporter ATP-binding protein n=1 Tax=uncultured Bilophila sp. TaxID=529385 RepID=UPI00280C3BD1|nr:oligopeptide/dipeptide ABC transporter ATP-binding protein [uncultured Bilophila sp.]